MKMSKKSLVMLGILIFLIICVIWMVHSVYKPVWQAEKAARQPIVRTHVSVGTKETHVANKHTIKDSVEDISVESQQAQEKAEAKKELKSDVSLYQKLSEKLAFAQMKTAFLQEIDKQMTYKANIQTLATKVGEGSTSMGDNDQNNNANGSAITSDSGYTLQFVFKKSDIWNAVLQGDNRSYTVSAGDKLPDDSVVEKIDSTGIELRKGNKKYFLIVNE